MKRNWRGKLLSMLLAAALAGMSIPASVSHALKPGETIPITANTQVMQLTISDIQAMNGGNVRFSYDESGHGYYVTAIDGRFSGSRITGERDVLDAIGGVSNLLGLAPDAELFFKNAWTDNHGYTCWVFQQMYGTHVLQYTDLKVLVDPDGYTCGLTSSITPEVGKGQKSKLPSASKARKIVEQCNPGIKYTFYPDDTREAAITIDSVTYNCVLVYTNNPNMSISFDMPYLEHIVIAGNEYMGSIPKASLESLDSDVSEANSYFTGLYPDTYTGTVTLADGTRMELTVPVAYNPADGLYYLCDLNRKMMMADYSAFNFHNHELDFVTSEANSGWKDNDLLTLYNYGRAYDFYAERGRASIDGYGMPILILTGFCEMDGTPVDNACYSGIDEGWAIFYSSEANMYGQCLDVLGHEYTHGVTDINQNGNKYENEAGIINEAISDIMGNIIEMSAGATKDTQWMIGENYQVIRCMSNPHAFYQPEYVGDIYYAAATQFPLQQLNDLGGVHQNNSLVSNIAYKLYQKGMPLDCLGDLWYTAGQMMTSQSGYDDLYISMMLSCRMNGLTAWQEDITALFQNKYMLGDVNTNARMAMRKDCGRIEFADTSNTDVVELYTVNVKGMDTWPDPDYPSYVFCWPSGGVCSVLVPKGNYVLVVHRFDDAGDYVSSYVCADSGWTEVDLYATSLPSDVSIIKVDNGSFLTQHEIP